ncbi:hypothetical protein MRX96_037493 [Rhipicephalus microplus]
MLFASPPDLEACAGPDFRQTAKTIGQNGQSFSQDLAVTATQCSYWVFYAPIPVGGLELMGLRTSIPYIKTNRVERLLYSDHNQCTVVATKDFIRKALRQAQDLTQFAGDVIGSTVAARRYWTRNLHSSFDGIPQSQCPAAPCLTT